MTMTQDPDESRLYPHLGDAARAVIDAGLEARIRFIKETHWIGYAQADLILARMKELLDAPRVDRPECLVILGDTNNGKTSILQRFANSQVRIERGDGSGSEWPVVTIQAPPVADEKRLYTAILHRVGGLGASLRTRSALFTATITTLSGIGTRMLVIDEIHHLISGSTNQHRICLNALKYLANELRLSIVVAGISDAHYSLGVIDPQLENRFKPMQLPRWIDGVNFRRLLASIEMILPLKKPSILQRPVMAKRLAILSDGKIGELLTILVAATVEAIRSGKECIDEGVITQIQDIAPAYRRRTLRDDL
ncbi:transposase [Geothrix limicola]|uniref:Transposase n=1 Tax=Geothrix limicola TaxID=2927978 RepID=A0ABQ5QLH4_9BACT|nr:TniB family NTP-binding protein [Geothrix limicola]GLH74900.1 transposase [Geothrix limicola]